MWFNLSLAVGPRGRFHSIRRFFKSSPRESAFDGSPAPPRADSATGSVRTRFPATIACIDGPSGPPRCSLLRLLLPKQRGLVVLLGQSIGGGRYTEHFPRHAGIAPERGGAPQRVPDQLPGADRLDAAEVIGRDGHR